MNTNRLSNIAGISYIIIFLTAIFANFFVVESLKSDPLHMVSENNLIVRLGTIAFLITVTFDIIVAWILFDLYKNQKLALPSMLFRMLHAAIMGVSLFALVLISTASSVDSIYYYLSVFEIIWLIGLFFFGIHLILLSRISNAPKVINYSLCIAGIMYMIDTYAHFVISDYQSMADTMLVLVAVPSILGEMSFAIWLLLQTDRK